MILPPPGPSPSYPSSFSPLHLSFMRIVFLIVSTTRIHFPLLIRPSIIHSGPRKVSTTGLITFVFVSYWISVSNSIEEWPHLSATSLLCYCPYRRCSFSEWWGTFHPNTMWQSSRVLFCKKKCCEPSASVLSLIPLLLAVCGNIVTVPSTLVPSCLRYSVYLTYCTIRSHRPDEIVIVLVQGMNAF